MLSRIMAQIVNDIYPVVIFAKCSIIGVWEGLKHASDCWWRSSIPWFQLVDA